MSKSSFVIRALRILGLEEMLKLSEVLQVRQVPLKKAAGAELVAWDDAVEEVATSKPSPVQQDAQVLPFPKRSIREIEPQVEPEKAGEVESQGETLLSSDIVLWQRELTRQTGDNVQKLDAFKGYRKSTEMYVVKTQDFEGKSKIRFASTNGVLINKKQA